MRKYRKAVFIVCYKKEKNKILYLLLKRKLHWTGWEFPKGGIEKNETPFQAVIRELKEEAGQKAVKITNCNFSGRYKYEKKYADRKGLIGQEFLLFSAELKNKKIKLDRKEHSDYKWLEFNQAIKLLTWKNQKDCLNIVNKTLL
jgi:tRNA nucleotidyltransferase (CCA-adding enzyme)